MPSQPLVFSRRHRKDKILRMKERIFENSHKKYTLLTSQLYSSHLYSTQLACKERENYAMVALGAQCRSVLWLPGTALKPYPDLIYHHRRGYRIPGSVAKVHRSPTQ